MRNIHNEHLRNLVRDKEIDSIAHRIELAELLDKNEWLGDKENYLPYHDPIWWMGHEDTSAALIDVWEQALDNQDTEIKSFGGKSLTSVYKRTKMLSLLSVPRTFWGRVRYLFTGKVTKK